MLTLSASPSATTQFGVNVIAGPTFVPRPSDARIVVSGTRLFLLLPAGPLADAPLRVTATAFDADGPPALGVDAAPEPPGFAPALG
jgi:hypothetical protein